MRRRRWLVIVVVAVSGALLGLLALALVIHIALLSTERFNWLEVPREKSESRLTLADNRYGCHHPTIAHGDCRLNDTIAPL